MRFSIKMTALLLAFVAINQNIAAQSTVIDEIIWVVGDEAILRSDVEEHRRALLMSGQRIEGDLMCTIPEQLAIQKLFLNQARIDSIEVSEAAVNRVAEAQLNEWIASIGSVERLEEYFGRRLPAIREDLRTRIREDELIQSVQHSLFGTVRLTPSEIRRFYENMSQDDIPFIPTTIELQIITVDPVIPIEEVDIVKARLREFTDQINSGERTFQQLAILSECPSALRGGELGFMGRAMLQPPFANAAFALTDPTRVSNVVETEEGYHIIQLIERRGDQANFRHILLRPRIPEESFYTALAQLDSIRTAIVDERITFDDAATFLSSDAATRNNRGIMVNTPRMRRTANSNTPRFGLDELNQDIARIVGNMAVGEVSQPFVMRRDNGQQTTAIVKVSNRTEGQQATLTRDFQVIRELAESARQQEMVDDWLRRTILRTYVRIKPAWQNCEFQFDGWIR